MTVSKESKDAVFLMIIQGMNYLLPLIVLPYLIVRLGADGYGQVGFAFAYTSYFVLIVEFGFNLSAVKRLVAASGNSLMFSEIFTATVIAKGALMLLCLPLFIILPLVIEPLKIYRDAIYFTSPMLLGQTLAVTWYFQSIGKIRVGALFYGLSKLLLLPLIFVFVRNPDDYNIAAVLQSGVILLSSLIALVYLSCKGYLHFSKVGISSVRTELRESRPLFYSVAATSIYTQLFTLILGFFSSPAVVGCYSAADRLIRALTFSIYTPVSQAFFPKVARLADVCRMQGADLCRKIMVFLTLIMGCAGIILLIFAPQICSLLGKSYPQLPLLLRIMAFVPLVISLGGVCGQLGLIAMGDSDSKKDFQRVYIYAGIFSIILISVMAPLLHDAGAAIAMTATEVFVTVLMFYYVKKIQLCFLRLG